MSRIRSLHSPQPHARLAKYAQRFQELKRGLDQLEYFCKGTVLKRMTKCGKAYCACASDPTKRHGPYFELTYKVDAKTVNVRQVWSSYCTRSFKPRGQPCATGEVSTRLRVPIGHLGQEPVVAQCAPPLPPSTWHRSVSYAPQTGSCK